MCCDDSCSDNCRVVFFVISLHLRTRQRTHFHARQYKQIHFVLGQIKALASTRGSEKEKKSKKNLKKIRKKIKKIVPVPIYVFVDSEQKAEFKAKIKPCSHQQYKQIHFVLGQIKALASARGSEKRKKIEKKSEKNPKKNQKNRASAYICFCRLRAKKPNLRRRLNHFPIN